VSAIVLLIVVGGAAAVVARTAFEVYRDGYRQRPVHSGFDTRNPNP